MAIIVRARGGALDLIITALFVECFGLDQSRVLAYIAHGNIGSA